MFGVDSCFYYGLCKCSFHQLNYQNESTRNMFTQKEFIGIVYSLGEAKRKLLLESKIYAQRFSERAHPNVREFSDLKQRFGQMYKPLLSNVRSIKKIFLA